MIVTKKKLMYISILITLLGMPFGFKIFGRFAVSNLTQIISVLLILPLVWKEKNRKYILGLIETIFFMLLGSIFSVIKYGNHMRLSHILFFILVYIFFGYVILCLNKNEDGLINIIIEAFRISVYIFFVVFAIKAYQDIFVLKKGYTGYFFDDKSHAVIFLAFYAILSLKLIKGKKRWIFSVFYLIFSMMTISRLIAFFLLFYLIYIYQEIKREFGKK